MRRGRRIDEVCNLGTMFSQLAKRSTRMLVSSTFKVQVQVIVRDDHFSKVGNVFFFRWSAWCRHQASVEIIFYWAWLIISIWENEPKLPHRFSLTFQHPLIKKVILYSCSNLLRFFLTFSLWLYFFSMIILWLEIHCVFLRFFLSFDSVTSVVTAYNVGVFKPS